MRVVFWLLDINYEVRDHRPEVRLWGIDDEGKRVLIVDERFLPYFYLVLREGAEPEAISEDILKMKDKFPLIEGLEILDKKYFGKPRKAIRVVCKDPDIMPKYSGPLSKVPGVETSLEDDIRFSMRYLIDNGVTPSNWIEVEAEEIENRPTLHVEGMYAAKSQPRQLERSDHPQLRVLGFTMIAYSRIGTPKPEKDPILILSAATNRGDEVQFTAEGGDDRALIERFERFLTDFNPDVIIGYGSNQIHWPYLIARANRHKIRLSVDKGGGLPHTSLYGHVSITGRVNVDLYDFADEFPQVKVKTLENLADFLGVVRLKDRTIIEDPEIPAYWDDVNRRPALLRSSMENIRSIMGIAQAILDDAIQLSVLVGIPLDFTGTAATGFKVDWFLIRNAYRVGELVPSRVERPYIPYEGGLVLEPRAGIHENVAVLDFKSMYPNIMIARNISPDTYIHPEERDPPSGVYVAPEVGYRFRKDPPGFYKEILIGLIRSRDEIRKRLGTLKPGSTEYRVLDARQKAVKVITNAMYGYAGWLGARWYLKPVAEATAAWGRETIRSTIEFAKEIGLEVIYGDTDSIFIIYEPKKVEELSRKVEKDLQLEMKPDVIYTRILFTEAKKRYCGLLPDGRLDIVGLEVIRGDWAAVAKDVQEEALGILLRDRSVEGAAELVRRYVSDLMERRIPYKDLIIWKTLSKPLDEYKVKAAHVEAARMLMKAGWDLSLGDKVGYVITLKGSKLYEKAKPYTLASYEEIDLNYYVENQIKPAALRILGQFGITEKELDPF